MLISATTVYILLTRTNFPRCWFFTAFTEPLIVDKSAIAGFGVLEIKFTSFVPQEGVVSRQDFAIENGICLCSSSSCNWTANL